MNHRASVGADERLRLFLALRLPEPVLDAIETWQQEHLRDVADRLDTQGDRHVTTLEHRPASG